MHGKPIGAMERQGKQARVSTSEANKSTDALTAKYRRATGLISGCLAQ
jgi:hypothetical protein